MPGTGTMARGLPILLAALVSIPSHAAQGMPDAVYRGWLNSDAGPIAVLHQGGRELVVAVGDTVLDRWTIARVDGASVTLLDAQTGARSVLWFGGGSTTQAPPSAHTSEPTLRWGAPAAVAPESQFSVVVTGLGAQIRGGEVTLEYDPRLLALVDATTEHEDAPGRTRLKLTDSPGDDYLADVTFRAVAQQTTVAHVRMASVALVDATGATIAWTPLDDLVIRIAARSQGGRP